MWGELGVNKGGEIGYPIMPRYIINSRLTRDLSFAMELLRVNAHVLSPSPLLYMNCLDLDSHSYVKSSNLVYFRFPTVLGHVSFPKDLRERRLRLSVRSETLSGLEAKASLVVIKVKSSCFHKVNRLFLNFFNHIYCS